MDITRKRQGRPKNPNCPPANTHLATRKEVLDELDRLVNYSRMPLGRKLESLIAEVKMHRKNLVGQERTSRPGEPNIYRRQTNMVNQLNEPYPSKWTDEETQLLVDLGWRKTR